MHDCKLNKLFCVLNLGLGCLSTLQHSCDPMLNIGHMSNTQGKAIHHCWKTNLTSYSQQSLTIHALVVEFCNNFSGVKYLFVNLTLYCRIVSLMHYPFHNKTYLPYLRFTNQSKLSFFKLISSIYRITFFLLF